MERKNAGAGTEMALERRHRARPVLAGGGIAGGSAARSAGTSPAPRQEESDARWAATPA